MSSSKKRKKLQRRLKNRLKKKEEEKKFLNNENITFVVDRKESVNGIEYFPKHDKIVTISRSSIRFWDSKNGNFISVIAPNDGNIRLPVSSDLLKWDDDFCIASHIDEQIGIICVEKCQVETSIPLRMKVKNQVKLMKVGEDEFTINCNLETNDRERVKRILVMSFSQKKVLKTFHKHYGQSAIAIKSKLVKNGIFFSPLDWVTEIEIRFVDWVKDEIIRRLILNKSYVWKERLFRRSLISSMITYMKDEFTEMMVISLHRSAELYFYDTVSLTFTKIIENGTARDQNIFQSLLAIRNDYVVGGNMKGDLNFFRLKQLMNYEVVTDSRRFSVEQRGEIQKILLMDHEKFSCRLLVLYHIQRSKKTRKKVARSEFCARIVNVHHVRLDPFDEHVMERNDMMERLRFLLGDDFHVDLGIDDEERSLCLDGCQRVDVCFRSVLNEKNKVSWTKFDVKKIFLCR